MYPSDNPFSHTRSFLEHALRAGAFPCAAAACGTVRETLFRWISGHAAIKPEIRPVMDQTLFDLASLTKVLATTLTALRLIDCGLVTPETAVGHFYHAPLDKAAITIQDILYHRAGFPAHFPLQDRCTAPAQAVEAILHEPLSCPPGTQVIYSCMGFVLLGRMLEEASGLPLDRLTAKLVLSPAGMLQTCFLPITTGQQHPAARLAAATEWDPHTGCFLQGEVHDENARFLGGVSGNAGLFAPLDDCIKAARMLLGGCQGFLSPELYQLMVHNGTPGCSEGRGLGMAVWDGQHDWSAGPLLGPGAFGHTGFTGTSLYISPQYGLFFILLTNRVHFGRNHRVIPQYRALFHEAVLMDLGHIRPA